MIQRWEGDADDDPPPASLVGRHYDWSEMDPAPVYVAHTPTEQVHLEEVERQNIWIEGLRGLVGGGEDEDWWGPIEVEDGEIVPEKALAETAPHGARVYEATGNEGASLELQYRRAVLVLWRRNDATLKMLARCGGRRALATESALRRGTKEGWAMSHEIEPMMRLWREAIETDGGAPEPRAHELVIDAVEKQTWDARTRSEMRDSYIRWIASVDLDSEAASEIARWLAARVAAGEPTEEWVRALRKAMGGRELNYPRMSGAPVLLRALCGDEATQPLAIAILGAHREPPSSVEAVLKHAEGIEERLVEDAWERRRTVRRTAD